MGRPGRAPPTPRQRAGGPPPLVDSTADAAACGLVVLGGRPARLTDIDVRRVGASLAVNGSVEESGVASAVMGNPINSVAWLADKLHEYGVTLGARHIVMSRPFIKDRESTRLNSSHSPLSYAVF